MKRGAYAGTPDSGTERGESPDIPPTQPYGEYDDGEGSQHSGMDEEDVEGGEGPDQPDLGWYFSNWELSDQAKIAICRTFANYLSARIPKVVEGPKRGFTAPRKISRK